MRQNVTQFRQQPLTRTHANTCKSVNDILQANIDILRSSGTIINASKTNNNQQPHKYLRSFNGNDLTNMSEIERKFAN